MAKTLTGLICKSIEKGWQNIRVLFHRNDSLFDILFLLVYFIEQLGLVYFTMEFRNDMYHLPYVISFFALVLLTTVGIHRLFMESRNKFVREQHNNLILYYYKLETSHKLLHREYKQQDKLLEELFRDNEKQYNENEKLRKDKS